MPRARRKSLEFATLQDFSQAPSSLLMIRGHFRRFEVRTELLRLPWTGHDAALSTEIRARKARGYLGTHVKLARQCLFYASYTWSATNATFLDPSALVASSRTMRCCRSPGGVGLQCFWTVCGDVALECISGIQGVNSGCGVSRRGQRQHTSVEKTSHKSSTGKAWTRNGATGAD